MAEMKSGQFAEPYDTRARTAAGKKSGTVACGAGLTLDSFGRCTNTRGLGQPGAMATFMHFGTITAALAAFALALPCGAAESSAYPTHPVRIVVNLTPGGGVDTVARIAAAHYS